MEGPLYADWTAGIISHNDQMYIQLVDRMWQRTGDDDFLKEFYPSVKADLTFIKSLDHDENGVVDVFESGNYLDSWPMTGTAIHVAGYWLAVLQIAERMAEKMGDLQFAEQCRTLYEKCTRSLEDELWNEQAGSYLLFYDPLTGKKNDIVLSDQLVGQWIAVTHGLPDIFPENRVATVLATLKRLNMASTPYGIRVGVHPDGSAPQAPDIDYGICPSYSSHVPAMLMLYSADQDGIEIIRRIWRSLVIDSKVTWDMPSHISPTGPAPTGNDYYHNTMLWSLPMAVFGQDLRSFSAPGGFLDRIIHASRP